MRILSFSTYHDSSVCAINDGQIEFFCKEERLTGVKRDSFPFMSLDLYSSLNLGKIDYIISHIASEDAILAEVFKGYIRKKFKLSLDIPFSESHHKFHASLAFFNSGFKTCLVFVVDRQGTYFFINNQAVATETESVFKCSYPDNITPVYKAFSLKDSFISRKFDIYRRLQSEYSGVDIKIHDYLGIVKVYEAATTLIDQNPLENGKTMGLSSYGEDLNYETFFVEGSPISNYFSLTNNRHARNVVCFDNFQHLVNSNITEDDYQLYANKAKHVQLETQEAVLRIIKKYVDTTGINNVCLVGGYGLNVIANNHYIKNLPGVNFYFEPLSDDTGVAIGAAMLKYRMESKDDTIIPLKDTFYHYYESETISGGREASLEELTDILISQNSLGIFEGSPEAGPRALGHRSILFDPRNPLSKDIVNKIKKREWYRPFAAVVLKDKIEEYFESNEHVDYSFMTVGLNIKESKKDIIPGVTHVDGSCRVQTVSEGFLYDLLTEFYKKTGCPVLLNTSLNLAGSPLAQTKNDALSIFYNSDLNAIYFVDDNKIFKK